MFSIVAPDKETVANVQTGYWTAKEEAEKSKAMTGDGKRKKDAAKQTAPPRNSGNDQTNDLKSRPL